MKKLSLGLILVSILNSTVLAYENRYSIEQEYAIINSCVGNNSYNKSKCICALRKTQKSFDEFENTNRFFNEFNRNFNSCY